MLHLWRTLCRAGPAAPHLLRQSFSGLEAGFRIHLSREPKLGPARGGCLRPYYETGFQPSLLYGCNPGASPQADMRRAFGPQNPNQLSAKSAESAPPYQPGAKPQVRMRTQESRAESPRHSIPRQSRETGLDPKLVVRSGLTDRTYRPDAVILCQQRERARNNPRPSQKPTAGKRPSPYQRACSSAGPG